MPTLQVAVVTGEKEIYRGEADTVIAPGTEGEMGILPEHAALLTSLKTGEMRIKLGGAEDSLFISGGFLEVYNNLVTVLADVAEQSDEINEERAQAARQHAQERLAEAKDDRERQRLNGELTRAVTRLRIVELTRKRGTRRIQNQMPESDL